MKKPLVVFLLVAIIGVAVAAVFRQARRLQPVRRPIPVPTQTAAVPETFGGENAKVVVTAFIPPQAEPSQRLIRALRSLVQQEGQRVRVEIFNPGQTAVQGEMQRRGLRDSTVLVNDRSEWRWTEKGRERQVKLVGALGTAYPPSDVIQAIDQELVRAYGHGLSPAQRGTLLQMAQGPRETPAGAQAPPPKPGAKLKVEVFLPPSESPAYHFLKPTLEVIEKWQKRYPRHIQVIFYHRADEATQRSLQQRGLEDVCVLINGRSTHVLKRDGQEKQVVLGKAHGQPSLTYQAEDLEALLRQYLQGIPGPSKGGG
jgi:hypothetical protein